MGIERYLCVGGIEVANPLRTLAYFRALGNPCMVSPPSPAADCCCPEFAPPACLEWDFTAEVTASAAELCTTISLPNDGPWNVVVWRIQQGEGWANFACGAGRPADPSPNDPGWQIVATALGITPDSWPPLSACFPLDALPESCGFIRYVFTHVATGQVLGLISWLDFTSVGPGDVGSCAWRWQHGLGDWDTAISGTIPTEVCPPWSWTPLQLSEGDPAPEPVETLLEFDPDGEETWEESLPGSVAVAAWKITEADGLGCPLDGGAFEVAEAAMGAGTAEADPPEVAVAGDAFTIGPIPDQDAREIGPLCFAYVLRWSTPAGLFDFLVMFGPDQRSVGPLRQWGGGAFGLATGEIGWEPAFGSVGLAPPCEPCVEGDAYTDPATDDAPWYDPAVPESADVLGVWIEEARLGVPWSREARQRIRGASLGPGRLGGRELQLSGWLYTRSAAATAYGRQWLFEALAGAPCGGSCDLPDAEIAVYCDGEGGGFRTLKRVGLTAFDPEIEPEFPRTCGFKFEATVTAEIPELFLAAEAMVEALPIADAEAVCNLCHPCPEPAADPCACGALLDPVRVAPVPDPAASYCEPIEIRRSCVQLSPPHYWRDASAILRIRSGSGPLANLRIRAWPNPAALDDPDLFRCQDPCLSIEVGCVPAGAELVIDGTTRQATVICGAQALNGYAYLSSGGGQRFEWPDVSCHGLMLCVDADAANTAADAELDVDFVLRERG